MFSLFKKVQRESIERGSWVDIYFVGRILFSQSEGVKIPESHYGKKGFSWGGEYKIWRIKGKSKAIRLYNPLSVIKISCAPCFKEVFYAVKSFFSVLSSFEGMEVKCFDGEKWAWEEVDADYDGDPYYVCARFANGRHIPVPILADWDYDEHRLQKLAIQMALFFTREFVILEFAEAYEMVY